MNPKAIVLLNDLAKVIGDRADELHNRFEFQKHMLPPDTCRQTRMLLEEAEAHRQVSEVLKELAEVKAIENRVDKNKVD